MTTTIFGGIESRVTMRQPVILGHKESVFLSRALMEQRDFYTGETKKASSPEKDDLMQRANGLTFILNRGYFEITNTLTAFVPLDTLPDEIIRLAHASASDWIQGAERRSSEAEDYLRENFRMAAISGNPVPGGFRSYSFRKESHELLAARKIVLSAVKKLESMLNYSVTQPGQAARQ